MNIGILTQDKEFGKTLREIVLSTKNKVFSVQSSYSVKKDCQWIYDKYCSIVFIDFIEEDLTSIKIMQTTQGKVERKISFVFLFSDYKKKEGTSDHIVSCLNEGALGFLLKETPSDKLDHYVRKIINRYQETIKKEDKGRELAINLRKVSALERENHRSHELIRKKNQFILDHLNEIRFGEISLLFLSSSKYRYEKFMDFFMETEFPFFITHATSLESAEKECEENSPDVIISDFVLPDGTALDLNKVIREKKGISTVRILVLTADEKNLLEVEKPESKMDGAMIRPSNRDEYRELLVKVLLAAKLPTVEGEV